MFALIAYKVRTESPYIAVLLFTHDSKTEVKHKSFSSHSGKKVNIHIAERLIQSAKSRIIKSKLPYFICTTQNQNGITFGERLANAIEQVFDQGFEKVIVTGNDSPDLTVNSLTDAGKLLKENDLVIGPTQKGGTYLIGLSRKNYNRKLFEGLSWQTGSLLNSLIHYAQNQTNSYAITKRYFEINNQYDILSYIKKFGRRKFSQWIVSLLSSNYPKLLSTFIYPKTQLLQYFFRLTAPPMLVT